jgi:hypothetical protein
MAGPSYEDGRGRCKPFPPMISKNPAEGNWAVNGQHVKPPPEFGSADDPAFPGDGLPPAETTPCSPAHWQFKPCDSRELDEGDFRPNWLVTGLWVAGLFGCIGGIWKTLKTSVVIDLAISLGSATPFLGFFPVPRKVRVAVLSGESGSFTLQETARRVCRSRGIDLADVDVLWQFDLPQLGDLADLTELADGLKAADVEVVIIDPLYLCLLTGEAAGSDASKNVYAVGPLLMALARVCLDAGCTPIIVHHANRSLEAGKVMELAHLSGAGVAEFSRQWILLSRCEEYRGDGRHVLWLNAGGSCGQGGCYQLVVNEGRLAEDFTGRTWEVDVSDARTAHARSVEEKGRAAAERLSMKQEQECRMAEEAIRAISLAGPPHAATINKLRDELHWGDTKASRAVHHLLKAGRIGEQEVMVSFGSNHARSKKATGYVISGPNSFPSVPSEGNNSPLPSPVPPKSGRLADGNKPQRKQEGPEGKLADDGSDVYSPLPSEPLSDDELAKRLDRIGELAGPRRAAFFKGFRENVERLHRHGDHKSVRDELEDNARHHFPEPKGRL